jgi:hypothetical protein
MKAKGERELAEGSVKSSNAKRSEVHHCIIYGKVFVPACAMLQLVNEDMH